MAERPRSIGRFTSFLWLGTATDLFNRIGHDAAGSLAGGRNDAGQPIATVAPIVVLIALSMLLWWMIARRGWAIGRWLYVACYLLAVAGYAVTAAAAAGHGSTVLLVLRTIALTLHGLALWMLFEPGSRAWFARTGDQRSTSAVAG